MGKKVWIAAVLVVGCVVAVIWDPLGAWRPASTTMRWALASWHYKSGVRSSSTRNGLQHLEWDGWGMGGMETVEYLVHDPADRLKSAGKQLPGEVMGSSKDCGVWEIRRMEAGWYVVGFYTNEDWGQCGSN